MLSAQTGVQKLDLSLGACTPIFQLTLYDDTPHIRAAMYKDDEKYGKHEHTGANVI